MRRPWGLVLALTALASAAAPASAQVAGQWRDARHIWEATCAFCHRDGPGKALPGTRPTPALTRAVVRRGIGGMPAFTELQIGEAELEALAQWLSREPAPAPEQGRKP